MSSLSWVSIFETSNSHHNSYLDSQLECLGAFHITVLCMHAHIWHVAYILSDHDEELDDYNCFGEDNDINLPFTSNLYCI